MKLPSVRRISGLVADGVDVDLASALPADQRGALRIITGIRDTRGRLSVESARQRASWIHSIGGVLGAVAAVQIALALAAVATGGSPIGNGRVPRSFQLTTMIVCAGAAAVLGGVAAGDPAARALALIYVGIAGAFANLFALPPAWLPLGLQPYWVDVSRLPGDLALIVGVWLFVVYFPRAEVGAAAQHLTSNLARVAVTVAAALFVLHVWIAVGGHLGVRESGGLLSALDRHARGTRYWAIVFPLMALALPFAVRKLQLGYVTSRRQVRLFLGGLALGLGPIVILSAIGSSSGGGARFLRGDIVFPIATWIVFVGLWTLPLTTAAAVLTRDVLPLQFVVRRSLQYTLTRRALSAAIGIPILASALLLASNPAQTIGEFLANGGSTWLTAAALAVLAALFRRQILRGIDRVFLRTQVDPRALIADLTQTSRRRLGARDAGEALLRAVDAAFHPRHAALLVASAGGEFVPLVGQSAPLSTAGALARVLEASPNALSFTDAAGLAGLLPAADRAWASNQGWSVLIPLHGEGERLTGVLCVGARRSADDMSADDLATLEALCASVGPLISARVGVTHHAERPSIIGTECKRCGRLFEQPIVQCVCGGVTVGSALPVRVGGRFTLRRRLGRGGMGVVYQATDDALERDVALKTLTEIGPAEARQLRAEARMMASLHHPGLAFVLGLETFGPLPVLVVEFLAGGTLADRLRGRPMPAGDVVRLGIALTDALMYLHEKGLLHRDLKPSNVGFSAEGEPKLLDFGVAIPLASATASCLAGTMLYMPPEAFTGAAPSPAFDLWSLGVLLCEALLGRHPLGGMSDDDQRRSLQAGDVWTRATNRLPADNGTMTSVLARALSNDVARRYADAVSLRSALDNCR